MAVARGEREPLGDELVDAARLRPRDEPAKRGRGIDSRGRGTCGEIVDESALSRMLEAGELAGAGLDVFEHEPKVDDRLCKLAAQGKVVLLPHMSSATIESRIEMGEKVIINIRMVASGDRPPDRILPSMV